ncbi:MAG: Bug family tripartite tricarboxylate transporter substrate binding protein [Burkholderiales bacterium]
MALTLFALIVRAAATASIAWIGLAALPDAKAQSYPSRPIRIVVPFGTGSATDLLARQLGVGLASEFGQPVNIENRPGGAAIIGAEAVAKSPPDGYTILIGSSQSHATNSSLFRKLPYDPIADFAPVARLSTFPAVLVVHQSIPAKTVAEFVAYARQRPGQLNYASTGPGTQTHLQSAMLAAIAGLEVTHIPFKDAGQIFAAVGRGDVAFMFYPFAALGPVIQSGKVSVLASTGEKRSPLTPDTPTMIEAGFPELTLAAWNGLYVPAATPPDIIERIHIATRRTLENPEMRSKLAALGVELTFGSPRELAEFTRAEIERYRKLVAVTGLKAE